MKTAISLFSCLMMVVACRGETATADVDLTWPLPGDEAAPALGASVGTDRDSAQVIWRRLGDYGDSFLGPWKKALKAPDAPPPGDVLDAFNELSLAVTGPTGFWRKTVPNQWLGCDATPESAPCKRIAELQAELATWDAVNKQILALDPKKASGFLQRNEARLVGYLETYVPREPSAGAMKETAFYRKHLAAVLETMAGSGPSNANDL